MATVQAAVDTSCAEVRTAYEQSVKALQAQKEALEIDPKKISKKAVGTVLSHGRRILEKPLHTWKTGTLDEQFMVQDFVFRDKLRYNKFTRFGTSEYTLFYSVCLRSKKSKSQVVSPTGIEPVSKS